VVKPLKFMMVAGEASGDALGAELIAALRSRLSQDGNAAAPEFFGVSGPQMQAAGVETIYDFTRNAVFGFDAIARLWEFRRYLKHLVRLAMERQPDAIICIDFSGFNRRFAHAVKAAVRKQGGVSGPWCPKIIQYVSPQVWASRAGRANKLADDVDLLLSIFPFEKAWYAQRAPALRVAFVGHPIIERYAGRVRRTKESALSDAPSVVFLPGSRSSELKRHLPVMTGVLHLIRASHPKARALMVLSERMAELARQLGLPNDVELLSSLPDALDRADLAIAKSGTVTLECARFGVPTVVMYKTSAATYEIGKRIVQLKWIAMPNILADETVFPEFIQKRATAENIARAALEFLHDPARRTKVQAKLEQITAALGAPGANQRAADEILRLLAPASGVK
jgi:lipid-A-disaccharide synthase